MIILLHKQAFCCLRWVLCQAKIKVVIDFLPALRELKADRIFLQFFPFSHILNCREMSSTINIFKRMIKKPINTLKKLCIHTGNRSREVIQKRRVYVQKKEKRYSR